MTASQKRQKKSLLTYLPLIFIFGLAGLFGFRILTDQTNAPLPSVLIEKSAPKLELPLLQGSQKGGIGLESLIGQVSIVNIWGSWCGPCRLEHPLLVGLKQAYPDIQMVGINIRDKQENALSFLLELGNPYDLIGVDPAGRSMIEWGGYGVPETFIIDSSGYVRYKHVGPISTRILRNEITPLIDTILAQKASKL